MVLYLQKWAAFWNNMKYALTLNSDDKFNS